MRVYERARVKGHVRGYVLPENLCPDNDDEFRRWWPVLRGSAQKVIDRPNLVLSAGMSTLAARLGQVPLKNLLTGNSTSSVYGSGIIYQQALGTGNAGPLTSNPGLANELFRKNVTNFSVSGPLVVVSTYFNPSDYANAATTVAAGASTTTLLYLVSVTGMRVGDLVQVALPTGYEYHTITAIDATAITISFATTDALSAVPVAGPSSTVNQITAEAGMFGDESLNPSSLAGTAALTAGSAIVTGTGTNWATAWAGDSIQIGQGNGWQQIASVQSQAQLTLSANAPATVSGAFEFQGTPYNRVNALSYSKLSSQGFVFENDWTMGG